MRDENNNDEMPSDEEWKKSVLAYLREQKEESKENPGSWEVMMSQGMVKTVEGITRIEEKTENISENISSLTSNISKNTYFLAYISALGSVLILLALKIL